MLQTTHIHQAPAGDANTIQHSVLMDLFQATDATNQQHDTNSVSAYLQSSAIYSTVYQYINL